jgi:hypothetical protein
MRTRYNGSIDVSAGNQQTRFISTYGLVHESSIVGKPKYGVVPVEHINLALEVYDVKHLHERVGERCSGLLPSRWKPPLSENLMNEDVFWVGKMAAAVYNLHLMYAVDVVNREVAERCNGSRAVASAVVELDDQSKRSQGSWMKHPIVEHLRKREDTKG